MLLLADITNVDRTDLKPYCLLLETKDRRIHLALRSDDEVYGWKDDIYARTTLMGVSNPVNFVHKIHVGFDPTTGNFTVSVLPIHNPITIPIQEYARASLATLRLFSVPTTSLLSIDPMTYA
jgi:hypothetical protein